MLNAHILSACLCVGGICVHMRYGVAPITRLLKIIDVFWKRAQSKRLYSAQETHNFKEPTDRSHPVSQCPLLVYTYSNYRVPWLPKRQGSWDWLEVDLSINESWDMTTDIISVSVVHFPVMPASACMTNRPTDVTKETYANGKIDVQIYVYVYLRSTANT